MKPASAPAHIPALDGLRGIAILLVLAWHSVFHIDFHHYPALNRLLGLGRFGWSGVDLFFVLSGFLIGGILLDHRDSPRYFQTFYLRRAHRILPLYLVILGSCWLLHHLGDLGWRPFGGISLCSGRLPFWSFLAFFQNWGMALLGQFDRPGLGVTWSLAIEEQFYLTLPFLVRWMGPKSLAYLLGAVICVVPILRALFIHQWPHAVIAVYVLTPLRADALAIGVLCAVVVRRERSWTYLTSHRPWIYAALGSLGVCLLLLTLEGYTYFDKTVYGLEFSVLAFFYAALLLVAVTGDAKNDQVSRKIFCNPLLMKLGVIAYGTYLFHLVGIDLFRFLFTYHREQPPAAAFLGALALGIVSAIAVASASWRWFEKPLVRRGHAYDY